VWTFRDLPRAKISVSWDMETPLTRYGDIKAESLGIDSHPKQVKSLTSCTEVKGLLGAVKFGIQGMK
jgi:hypothetical protein